MEHLHTGIPGFFQKLLHRREQKPQILGDDRHVSQRPAQRFEKVDARPLHPLAVDSGLLPVRDGVIRVEGAEVVDPGHVEQPAGQIDPVHPPVVFGLFQKFPIIQGVPPKLPGFRKVIRRTARHTHRPAAPVQPEDLRVGPGIGAVHGHINRHIPKNQNPQGIHIGLQLPPLPEKQELDILPELHLGFQPLFILDQASFPPEPDPLVRPLQPGDHAEMLLDRHKQGVISQPALVIPPEPLKFLPVPGCAPLIGQPQHLKAAAVKRLIVHPQRVSAPVQGFVFLLFQQALLLKQV